MVSKTIVRLIQLFSILKLQSPSFKQMYCVFFFLFIFNGVKGETAHQQLHIQQPQTHSFHSNM